MEPKTKLIREETTTSKWQSWMKKKRRRSEIVTQMSSVTLNWPRRTAATIHTIWVELLQGLKSRLPCTLSNTQNSLNTSRCLPSCLASTDFPYSHTLSSRPNNSSWSSVSPTISQSTHKTLARQGIRKTWIPLWWISTFLWKKRSSKCWPSDSSQEML